MEKNITYNWILTDATQVSEDIQQDNKINWINLYIGLDFGTAFTKVIIGERRTRYAVPFENYTNNINPYLLPSAFNILNDNQECILSSTENHGHRVEDLKMRLISRQLNEETKIHCIVFLSLVLRYVRGWLLNMHKNTYRDRKIIWHVNLGLPTDSIADKKLVEFYKSILNLAWIISVLPGSITIERIKIYLQKINKLESIFPTEITRRFLPEDNLNIFPEFAVQLVGYIKSSQRMENLHSLADIGAGTFDFTTFNVHKNTDGDGVIQFPIFARSVKPLGTQFLISHRIEKCGHRTTWRPSPYEDVPLDEQFEKMLSINHSYLENIDDDFRKQVKKLITKLLIYTEEKRFPTSENWSEGVPTFLCGGGAHYQLYLNLFQVLEKSRPPCKIKIQRLIIPDDLDASLTPKNTYDRLSVAYGLAFDPLEISEVIPMEDIKNLTKDDMNVSTSNNIICQKCNGTGGLHRPCDSCNGNGFSKK